MTSTRYVLIGVVCIALLAVGATTVKLSSKPAPFAKLQPVTAAPAQGGKAKGGSAKPALPTGFPADVPLPDGQITGSTGGAAYWAVGINLPGHYNTVMPSLRDFYVSAGFTDLNPKAVIPYGFENATYKLQVVGREVEHTGPQTVDIDVAVQKK